MRLASCLLISACLLGCGSLRAQQDANEPSNAPEDVNDPSFPGPQDTGDGGLPETGDSGTEVVPPPGPWSWTTMTPAGATNLSMR